MDSGGSADNDVLDVEIEQKKQDLKGLCIVLGINYNSKLAEFGSKIDRQRLDNVLDFLRVTQHENFKQLKETCKELLAEWKLSNSSFKRMDNFFWILDIKDAIVIDDVKGKGLRSTSSVNKAKGEVASLKKARDDLMKKKYNAKVQKLKELISDGHLAYKDVGFDPDKKVEKEQYKSEGKTVKKIIKSVKLAAMKRKELVLWVELARSVVNYVVKNAVKDNWAVEAVTVLIHNAKDVVWMLKTGDAPVPYDGKDVEDLLEEFYQKVDLASMSREDDKRKKDMESLPNRTRRGTRYTIRVEDSDAEEDGLSNGGGGGGGNGHH